MPYPIAENEEEKDNTYLSYNKVIGNAMDARLLTAFEILDYALLSAPGAPLKRRFWTQVWARIFTVPLTMGFCSPISQ